MEIKSICYRCAGVIDGDIIDSSSGEYPCSCTAQVSNNMFKFLLEFLEKAKQKKLQKQQANKLQYKIHWPNGRECKNSN